MHIRHAVQWIPDHGNQNVWSNGFGLYHLPEWFVSVHIRTSVHCIAFDIAMAVMTLSHNRNVAPVICTNHVHITASSSSRIYQYEVSVFQYTIVMIARQQCRHTAHWLSNIITARIQAHSHSNCMAERLSQQSKRVYKRRTRCEPRTECNSWHFAISPPSTE